MYKISQTEEKTTVSILVGEQAYGTINLEDFEETKDIIDTYSETNTYDKKDNITDKGIKDFTLDKLFWRVGFCYNGVNEYLDNTYTNGTKHEYFPFFNWGYKENDEIIWREWPLFNTALKFNDDKYYDTKIGSKGMYGPRGVIYKSLEIGGAKLLTPPRPDDRYFEFLTNDPFLPFSELDQSHIGNPTPHSESHDSKNKHLLIAGSIVKKGKFCNVKFKRNQTFIMHDGNNEYINIFPNIDRDIFTFNKILPRFQEFSLNCINNICITNKINLIKKNKKVLILSDSPAFTKHKIGKNLINALFNKL